VSVRREAKFCLEPKIEVVQNYSLLVCTVQFLRGNRQVITATSGEIQTIERAVEEQRQQLKVPGLSLVPYMGRNLRLSRLWRVLQRFLAREC
jgi:hypothetical protein